MTRLAIRTASAFLFGLVVGLVVPSLDWSAPKRIGRLVSTSSVQGTIIPNRVEDLFSQRIAEGK